MWYRRMGKVDNLNLIAAYLAEANLSAKLVKLRQYCSMGAERRGLVQAWWRPLDLHSELGIASLCCDEVVLPGSSL